MRLILDIPVFDYTLSAQFKKKADTSYSTF